MERIYSHLIGSIKEEYSKENMELQNYGICIKDFGCEGKFSKLVEFLFSKYFRPVKFYTQWNWCSNGELF